MVIFQQAGYTRDEALLFTMGTGLVNWLFAIPAIYTIDTFGRRNLLLVTYPLMSFFLFLTGFSFFIQDPSPDETNPARLALVATGLFCFMACYSPGSGPVPFTYSAEAFPLHIRDIGMCRYVPPLPPPLALSLLGRMLTSRYQCYCRYLGFQLHHQLQLAPHARIVR